MTRREVPLTRPLPAGDLGSPLATDDSLWIGHYVMRSLAHLALPHRCAACQAGRRDIDARALKRCLTKAITGSRAFWTSGTGNPGQRSISMFGHRRRAASLIPGHRRELLAQCDRRCYQRRRCRATARASASATSALQLGDRRAGGRQQLVHLGAQQKSRERQTMRNQPPTGRRC